MQDILRLKIVRSVLDKVIHFGDEIPYSFFFPFYGDKPRVH